MSTYTDLHNKIKENLTVGYSPDDRITTQKVRFYNEGNEYWGTFKGSFRAEQVDLDGGELRNVKITNALLSNISWPAGVDFDAYGALLTNVSAEVDSINDDKLPFVHSRITEEMSARMQADGNLEKMIYSTDTRLSDFATSITKDLHRELSALKLDVTLQELRLSHDILYRSNELSTILDTKIDDVSAFFTDELYNVSSDLSAQDKAIYDEMISNDIYLSSELRDTQSNLADEIGNRARADRALKEDINSVSSISDIRDRILQNNIDQLNADASLSIDVLRDETNYNIEIERHYEYKIHTNSFTNIKAYPFQLDDYTVNAFKCRDIDGQVYLGTDTGVYIALVKKDAEDSIFPLTVFPYKNNKASYAFNSAFDTSKQSYTFEYPNQSISLGNGFNMIVVPPAQEEQKSQLSNYIFRVEPQSENCHRVYTQDGETNVGNVIAAYPTGSTGGIVSGLLTIDASLDPTYSKFSHFIKIPFNTTTLSAPEPDSKSTGFIYYGNNKFDLVKYHPLRYFTRLSDDLVGHDNVTFGSLYQTIGGNPAIISDELGNIKEINVFLDDYNVGQPISLKEENNFEQVLDDNYMTEDGEIAIISLKARVNNNTNSAIFSIGQQTTLYSYNFYGKDTEGDDVIPVGKITPRVFNRKIGQFDVDFNEITADVSHVIMFQSMNDKISEIGGLVLEKSLVEGESDIWYATVIDDQKNVLDAKYIGHTKELRLKLTLKNAEDSEIGQIIAQKYVVDLNVTTPIDGDIRSFTLHKTKEIDLGIFDQTTRKIDKYPIIVDPTIVDNSQNTWDLTITTAENDIIKAIVPPVILDVNGKIVLREFVIDATIQSTQAVDTTFRKIKLFDEHGCPITLVNTTQQDATSIYVNPNRRAIYAVKEVAPNQFAILDFNDEEDNHWIEVLTQKTNNLSTEIQLLSAALSNDISVLSSNLSADIVSLSTMLSTDISALSTNLCIDINYLSDHISADVFTLSTNLCIDIQDLSVELSTDISCLSSSLCNVINLSVENLQNQVISNDEDITFLSSTLSTLSVNISTDVSCLSANVSSDISVLSTHYFKTLSTDIKFDVVYHHDGSQDTLSRPIYTDQLLIIDEVTMDRYCLTIRNGALNIKKVDNQAIFD